jgi:glycosyl transferase, family 25
VHAYVINLARSRDRRSYITAELKKAGVEYEIVTAVDGRDLDLSDTALIDPSFLTRTGVSAGSAGASLSHLSVYRKIIADGHEAALVLEDDVRLPADLDRLADAVAAHLRGAEVALLSVDSPRPCLLSRDGVVALPGPGRRQLALPLDVAQPMSAGGYLITREACERFVKCLPPIRVQADSWSSFYREGLLDRLRCVAPLPVLKNPNFVSTIAFYSLGNGLRARLAAPLVRGKIPGLHQFLARRRQRIYQQWSRAEVVDGTFAEKPSRLD